MEFEGEVQKKLLFKKTEKEIVFIEEVTDSKNEEYSLITTVCDYMLITIVIHVSVVGFWRGLFGILSTFISFREYCILFFLGSFLHIQFTVLMNHYNKNLKKKTIVSRVFQKVYLYVFGCACVFHWAGLWFALEKLTGLQVRPPLIYSVISYIILICLKCSLTLLGSPFAFKIDSFDNCFYFPTAFKRALTSKVSKSS